MPLIGRRGPGLVRGAARTAVVAGTATAVSGRVAHRQQEKYAAKDAAAAAPSPGPATHVQAPDEDAAAAAPSPGPATHVQAPNDPIAQIERLAQLQQQGQLTAEEFTAMKAKILAG